MGEQINRRKFIKTTGAAGLGLGLMGSTAVAAGSGIKTNRGSSLLDINYRNLISRADLAYDKPVSRSEAGMPVGNGRMGSLIWTVPTAMKFQINRVDVFANNSASNNFYQRHSDYCGGVGFVDINFVDYGEQVFTDGEFNQHLSVYDGLITTNGKGIETQALAWHDQDVIALQVTDSRDEPAPVSTYLRMLRSPEVRKGDHRVSSEIEVIDDKILLKQMFEEDDYYCSSAVVIGTVGRQVQTKLANEVEAKLTTAPDSGTFGIFIASAASFDPEEDVVGAAVAKLEAARAKGFSGLLDSNRQWWHNFWEKSFVHLNSGDKQADLIEKHYTYYLYLMASTSQGRYPTKFNGMLWSTGGDTRNWGAFYWGANQSCLYNALLPTNRPELMDPVFNMYNEMYESCTVAARQQWGSKGVFFPETFGFDGLPEIPENIAEEMRALYLLEKPWEEMSEDFYNYAFTKAPHHSRWNWKEDAGWENGRWHINSKADGPFGHVIHIFSRGAKIAYQYWQKYEYTQDKQWLREHAYPMLKGVAEFYRNFPNVRKEADGKYHIYHVNDNESIWGAHNTVEEISAMRGIFPTVIRASEILEVDGDMRPVWQEFLDNLSPIPTSADYPSLSNEQDQVTWVRALEPVAYGNGARRPDGNTMPVWFFDLCTMESTDSEALNIANATFDSYYPDGIDENTTVGVLSKLPVTGTMLGRVEATKYLIPNQINTARIEPLPNRMDLSEGAQTTNAQRLGRAADALHYALCQSVPAAPGQDPVIRVFPAWPKEWNAQYTLLARGNFLVTSSMREGKIEFVEVLSQGGADLRLRNPWPDTEVIIYRNGEKWQNMQGDLLSFSTKQQDHFIVVVKGNTLGQLKQRLCFSE